jgi:hypothetical protein
VMRFVDTGFLAGEYFYRDPKQAHLQAILEDDPELPADDRAYFLLELAIEESKDATARG